MTRSETHGVSGYKLLADLLTASRLPLALVVVLLGAFGGRSALGAGLLLILVGWTTDIFDGRLARLDPDGATTRIGDADLAVDLILDAAGLALFALAGMVPAVPAAIYFLLAAIVIAIRPTRAVITYFELPVLALHPVMAFAASRLVGWLYVLWLAFAAALNRKRLFEILGVLAGRSKEGGAQGRSRR